MSTWKLNGNQTKNHLKFKSQLNLGHIQQRMKQLHTKLKKKKKEKFIYKQI